MKKFNKKTKMIFSFLMLVLFTKIGFAQTTITVGSGMSWVGYMNVYENDAPLTYQFGSGWAVPELKTVVNPGNGSIHLKPNYNTYNAADTYWSNGAIGNKIMEGNTYIEDISLLGQTLTFNGMVDSFTINPGYKVIAFIKVLDSNNGYITVGSSVDTLSSVGAFTTSLSIPNVPGYIPQYGFSVKGLNANPVNENAYGSVYIRGDNSPPLPTIDVTFQLQNPASMPVYVFGSWSGWLNWPGDMMTATSPGNYEITLQLPAGDTVEYLFVSGATPVKEVMNPADACTNGDMTFTNRKTILDTVDVTYCARWESCVGCGVGIEDQDDMDIEVNINNQILYLESSTISKIDALEIFDITGKKILSLDQDILTNQNIPVDIENTGCYFIRIKFGNEFKTIKTILSK